MKVEKTVAKETIYITAWTLVLSVLMQAVFIFLHKWDYTILLGNLLGGAISVLNFFCMGLFVQKAVSETEEEARKTMKLSYTVRTMAMFALIAAGVLVPFCSTIAVIISLFFSRVAIFFKAFFIKQNQAKEATTHNE